MGTIQRINCAYCFKRKKNRTNLPVIHFLPPFLLIRSVVCYTKVLKFDSGIIYYEIIVF